MKVQHVIDALEAIAPKELAAEWDSVGLLIGAGRWQTKSILLTIDLTSEVLEEAITGGSKMIVAYHPPIFAPLKAITDAEPRQRIVLDTARHGIAVYSPHTALDAAPDGVNDWLAQGLGDGDVRALDPHEMQPASQQCKIVTFCPAQTAETLRGALASVGAGRIGDYERCSFEIVGTGTFRGGAATAPAVGRRGALERVDEVRLEMVCPTRSLALAVTMLRQFHPYEEPPVEVYPLLPHPQRNTGHGRRVVLDRSTDLKSLVDRIRTRLGVKQVRVAAGCDAPRRYTTVGLCAGAGGSLAVPAIDQGCELFLTGEMRHHDVLAAQAAGCTVVLAGHTNTERGYLKVLRRRLLKALSGAEITVSKKDVDPLRVMGA